MTNPYGQPVPAYTGGADPGRRPGTVTAASIITIVLSALTFLASAAVIVVILTDRDSFTDGIKDGLAGNDAFTVAEVADIATVAVAVMAVWALVALALGVLTMRRHNWARMTLVVSSAVTILVSLLAILSLVTLITLAGAIAVIVLLFTGGANQWFARRAG